MGLIINVLNAVNDNVYSILVGVQRFSLLYATLYIPLAFRESTYLWVSLGYASLAIGGFIGYLFGFKKWFIIPMVILSVLTLPFKQALVPLLAFLGALHSVIVPNAYSLFGNRGVAKSYTASSVAYLVSGLVIYFTKTPIPLLVTVLLTLLPSINREAKEVTRYMVKFIINLDFLSIIPYTIATFIVGGLYTVYLSTIPNFGDYGRLILALSAGLMGVLRWVSDRYVDNALWVSIALTGVAFVIYTIYPSIVTALIFIAPYSLVYPLVTMTAGRGSKDPVTSINAAFAGTSTGESIMPFFFHYNKYLVLALSAILVILPLSTRLQQEGRRLSIMAR